MKNYGLIFRRDDGVWLGIYSNNIVSTFESISDDEGIYDTLLLTQFSLVEVTRGTSGELVLRDLTTIEISARDTKQPVNIIDMLEAESFPSESTDELFKSFLDHTESS